ncbi:MAG: hypothetical protein QXO75_12155 [Nitrososphaerota archaeon]
MKNNKYYGIIILKMICGFDVKKGVFVRISWSAETQKFVTDQPKPLRESGQEFTIIFLRNTGGSDYKTLLEGVDYKIMTESNPSKFTWFYGFLTGIFMSRLIGEGGDDYNLLRSLPKHVKGTELDYPICQDRWAELGGHFCKRKLNIKYVVIIQELVSCIQWVRCIKRIFAYLALGWQKRVLYNADRIFAETARVTKTVKDFLIVDIMDVFLGLKNNPLYNYRARKNQIVFISHWNEVKSPKTYIPLFKDTKCYNPVIARNRISLKHRNRLIDGMLNERVIDKFATIYNMIEYRKLAPLYESKFSTRFGQEENGPYYGIVEIPEARIPIVCNKPEISDNPVNRCFDLVLDDASETGGVGDFINLNDNENKFNALQSDTEAIMSKFPWQRHASGLIASITG